MHHPGTCPKCGKSKNIKYRSVHSNGSDPDCYGQWHCQCGWEGKVHLIDDCVECGHGTKR